MNYNIGWGQFIHMRAFIWDLGFNVLASSAGSDFDWLIDTWIQLRPIFSEADMLDHFWSNVEKRIKILKKMEMTVGFLHALAHPNMNCISGG